MPKVGWSTRGWAYQGLPELWTLLLLVQDSRSLSLLLEVVADQGLELAATLLVWLLQAWSTAGEGHTAVYGGAEFVWVPGTYRAVLACPPSPPSPTTPVEDLEGTTQAGQSLLLPRLHSDIQKAADLVNLLRAQVPSAV